MKIRILVGMLISATLLALTGCGGGGGGSTPAAPASTTVVSGTPFKGAFDTGGSVQIFGVDANGVKDATPLKATLLDAFGSYSVDIGTYTGPIVVEVTGTYKDEATGAKVTIAPEGPPLRAIISNAQGKDVKVNVTPLTELAAKKAGSVLTKSIIDAMNANVAALFKVDDIITTKPVDATTAAAATATTAEKNQSLALAAISQLVKNSQGKALDQVLSDMATDITPDATTPANVKLADRSVAGYKTAMFDFVNNTTLNQTGITNVANTPSVGTLRLAHLQINAVAPAGTTIGGIDFTFNLPTGVTLSKDALTNQVAPGVVVVSGVAAVTGTTNISLATLNGQALKTVLANAQGFGPGEFVDISCTLPAGSTLTAADFTSAVTAATLTATDLKGAPIAGVTLAVTPVIF